MSLPSAPPAPTSTRSPHRELVAHLVWEAVLLLGVAISVVLVLASGDLVMRFVWPQLASLGLIACGLALSLRTATPNLMVGPAGLLAAWLYAELANSGTPGALAALIAVAATAAYGVVVALADGLLTAPSWMLTLGAGLLVQAVFFSRQSGQAIPLEGGAGLGTTAAILWTLVFVVLSVGGGVLWMFGGRLRRGLSTRRDSNGPGSVSAAGVRASLLGIGGSTLLYAVAGVLLVQQLGSVSPGGDRLSLALGVVLLGGVSAWGRRGGLLGTVLATVIVVLLSLAAVQQGFAFWVSGLLVPGLAIVVGLAVGRLLEAVGGPDLEPQPGPVVVQVG